MRERDHHILNSSSSRKFKVQFFWRIIGHQYVLNETMPKGLTLVYSIFTVFASLQRTSGWYLRFKRLVGWSQLLCETPGTLHSICSFKSRQSISIWRRVFWEKLLCSIPQEELNVIFSNRKVPKGCKERYAMVVEFQNIAPDFESELQVTLSAMVQNSLPYKFRFSSP